MSNDVVIKVENVSKQYRLGLVGTGTIALDLNRWWARMRGKEDPTLKIGETNDRAHAGLSDFVWALKDINFEVKQGEVLGIIGRNGAGKSTLLKILSRVTAPTTGEITGHGRIASLLEVGTGFHHELTGRENIYLNGAINGMTKVEVKSKLDEIIEFSGCERYIDTPVKRYSSGMTVRLGFSVAAHLEPEILIVDEVLAVGDAEFQKKCIGKMQDVAGHGRTVLFVSHNMPSIQCLCDRAILLQNGELDFDGGVPEGIRRYVHRKTSDAEMKPADRTDRIGSGLLKFKDVIIKSNGEANVSLQTACRAEFGLKFEVRRVVENVIFRLMVVDDKDNMRFVCNNNHSSKPIERIEGNGVITLHIEKFPLPEGSYYYHLQAVVDGAVADEIEFAGEFLVEPGDFFQTGKVPALKDGVLVSHEWGLPTYG